MRRWLLLVLVLAGVVLVPITVTHAQPSPGTIPASGTIQPLGPSEVLSVQTVGGTTFIRERVRNRLTGTLTGTEVAEVQTTILPTGTVIFVGETTFTGTVAGRSGTLRYVGVFTANATTFQGQVVILRGTGGLANLRGQLTVQGSTQTGTGTYTGVLQFSP